MRERRWLPVVIDGDAAEAADLAGRMTSTLGAEGWPPPVILETPDRLTLLFRVRLRNDHDDDAVVSRALQSLAERFLGVSARVSREGEARHWAVAAVGIGAEHRRARLVRAPMRLEMVTRAQLLAGRSPEVQSVPAWDQDTFESGLEQLDRVFAGVPVDSMTASPPPGEVELPATPAPTSVVALRSGPRLVSTPLPVTDFGGVIERYAQQHQDRGARIRTGLAPIDEVVSALRGLVLLDGQPGEGRSTLSLQMAAQALLTPGADEVAVVVASFGLRRADVTDRLVSHVSTVPLDVLQHGRSGRSRAGADGLRLSAAERRQLQAATSRLEAVQHRLYVVDADWVTRPAARARPKEALAGLMADVKRSAGARRCLCVVDDFGGMTEVFPRVDSAAELLDVARAHGDDVLLVVTTGGGPEPLRRAASVRFSLTRGPAESGAGFDAMRLTASTRRSGAVEAHADLRFCYPQHRFDLDQ